MSNQPAEFSPGTLVSFAAVTVLMVIGFWAIMSNEHGGWGVLALVAAMIWALGIIGFADVFRVLYDFSVVVGMIVMVLFSLVVGIPRTIVKTYEKVRKVIVRSR